MFLWMLLFMAYHMCSREDADYYAFDILSDILSNGRSSRLTRRLVQEQKLFSSLDAYISGTRDAGPCSPPPPVICTC